jgi:phosphoribosyl-ATP pyrophosphohydrolase
MIIPCLKIQDGRVLTADRERTGHVDIAEVLGIGEVFSRAGEIAVVDVNAEQESGDNLAVLKALCEAYPCRVGGGIRHQERGRALLRAGAERIILGQEADPELLRSFRPMHVMLEIDLARTPRPGELIKITEPYCMGFLVTDVPADRKTGRLDLEEVRRLSMITDRRLCVDVDLVTVEEVASLDKMGVDVQVGEALLDGRLALAEAYASCIKWGDDGLTPTVVQDTAGQVLMLTMSSRESLEKSLRSGEGTYFSESRGGVWRKGERSGNDQLVLRCVPSCDRTALHFLVRQAGVACETGRYSCFGDREFSLHFLSEIASSKKSGDPSSSYTARLLSDPSSLEGLIREKVDEATRAERRDEAVWAIADLVYFLVVEAVSKGLSWGDVIRELRGRQR